MKQRSSWRQHLFGSIEGQLKLATGLVLLLGFSIASLGTLLVTRQNLIHDLEADSASINRSITGEAKALIALPTLERNRRLLQARERQTNWKHTVWLELADGTDLLPSHSEGSVPPEVIWELVGRHNPSATTVARETQMQDGTTVLSLRQNTPIAPAIRLGAEKVLVIGLTREVRGVTVNEGGAAPSEGYHSPRGPTSQPVQGDASKDGK
jgi:hypothetical protein